MVKYQQRVIGPLLKEIILKNLKCLFYEISRILMALEMLMEDIILFYLTIAMCVIVQKDTQIVHF